MTTLRCGRIDAHPPHDWSRPPGWSRPRRTYHCEGAPAVEGGHREERERCRRCGRENVRWFAPSPLWNFVMRGNDINGEPLFGDLVCIPCFIALANEAGVDPAVWRLTADPEPEGLVKVTPSGREWDERTYRWGPARDEELRRSAEELRITADAIEVDGYPEVAQKARDLAAQREREATR